jgi:N-acetylglucosamine malate deacetylase 1
MKLSFQNERIMAVVAHPDDAELLCSGTLLRAKAEGAAVAVCVLCSGDKGQPSTPIPHLTKMRRKEMAESSRILGSSLYNGKHPDGTLTDDYATRLQLIEIFRIFRATLIFAHSPEDYHPDHQAASHIAEAASWMCISRGQRTKHPPLLKAPSIWWMDTILMSGFKPEFYINISDHVESKEKMLKCHKSQLERGRDQDFAPLLKLMRLQYEARGAQADVPAAEAFRLHHSFKRVRAW